MIENKAYPAQGKQEKAHPAEQTGEGQVLNEATSLP